MTDSPLCSCAKPAGLIARPIRANKKTDRQYFFSIWLPPSKSVANQEGAGIVPPTNPAGKKASLRRRARCLLFDTPLDLISRHINQAIFQITFHVETR